MFVGPFLVMILFDLLFLILILINESISDLEIRMLPSNDNRFNKLIFGL